MKVLVTGCCGFLGSHLVKRIIKDTDWTVIGLDSLTYCASLKNIEDIPRERFVFIKGDFCDYPFLHYVFYENHFDIVFHIGAYTHVDNSFDNSLTFTRNNTLGTHTLLEVARKFKTPKFIHMSTDEVYGTIPEGVLADESFRFNPSNPYSVSKANAEELVRTYKDNYGMNIITVRGNNIIGTNQFIEKVIPKFIMRLLNRKSLCIHGTGTATRNFTAVEDMTRAILLISQKSGPKEIWNVGNVDKYTVLETAQKIISEMRTLSNEHKELFTEEQLEWIAKDDLIEHVEDRIFNDMRYDLNIEKIKKQLGFVPEISFDEELKKIVLWYVQNQDYYKDMNIEKYTKPHCH